MSKIDDNILLESGTNELEIIELRVGKRTFGVNVLKVREVIQMRKITPIPKSHPCVSGVIQLRNEIIPVVDLASYLGLPASENPDQDRLIIAVLNKLKVAFHVHDVQRIHRITWRQIEKPSDMIQKDGGAIIGIIRFEDQVIMLLDYEKIVVDINPGTGIHLDRIKTLGPRERSNKRIVIAEDSPLLRKLLEETLTEAGYVNLQFFSDGQLAWDYLSEHGSKNIHLVITDIEMPQMDGLHLIKRIKEDDRLQHLPTIIFSSLITDDLKHKGEAVGANAQVTKPEIEHLVQKIDQYILLSNE